MVHERQIADIRLAGGTAPARVRGRRLGQPPAPGFDIDLPLMSDMLPSVMKYLVESYAAFAEGSFDVSLRETESPSSW